MSQDDFSSTQSKVTKSYNDFSLSNIKKLSLYHNDLTQIYNIVVKQPNFVN